MNTKIIHITAGRGPAECMWVVAQTLKVLLESAKTYRLKVDVTQKIKGDLANTLASVTVLIQGAKLAEFTNEWEGAILWVGQSPYRKYHKRKNWFIELQAYLPPKELKINPNDVKYQTTKSSGPGGQHVNKTESAVRATHIPSGVSVLVQESRSQHQNKKIASIRLAEYLAKHQLKMLSELETNQWKDSLSIQRGNPQKIFEGRHFKPRK